MQSFYKDSSIILVSNANIKQGWTEGISEVSGFISTVFPGVLSLMAVIALIGFLLKKL